AGVSHGSFDVYDPADLSIISLEDAKQHLNIPLATTTDDEELRYFLSATTKVVANLAGAVAPRTVTESVRQRGTAYSIQLETTPVLSLTSLTSINGGLAYDVDSLYVANDLAGIIRREDEGTISGGPWMAVYRAGRAEVPPNIGLAARILVQHLWETQRGGPMNVPRLTVESADMVPGIWFAIPNKVKELLDGESTPLMAY